MIDDLIMSSSGLRPLLQTLLKFFVRDSILPRLEIRVNDVKVAGGAFRPAAGLIIHGHGIIDEFFVLNPRSRFAIFFFLVIMVAAIVASVGILQRAEKQEGQWQEQSQSHGSASGADNDMDYGVPVYERQFQ